MNKAGLFLCIGFFALFCPVRGQKIARTHLDRTKPTVYIEYLGRSSDSNAKAADEPEHLWFRLRNNTPWGIKILASGGIDPTRDDSSLYYDVLGPDDQVVGRHQCHVCSLIIIKGGKGVTFGVPSNTFNEPRSLRLEFSFEWEDRFSEVGGSEPRHFVYFSGQDLPIDVVKAD